MLAAEEDIANGIVEMAKRRGVTIYQTVNDILEQALRADGMGLVLKEVIDQRGMLERAREMGFTFTIERLLYDITDTAYERTKNKVSQMWQETGRWYGKFFASRDDDVLKALEEAMELLTFGASEFSIDEGSGGSISISCVGERFTLGFTDLFSLFIEGIFEALGYQTSTKEVSKGIIRLRIDNIR
jgi:hypothetical protein